MTTVKSVNEDKSGNSDTPFAITVDDETINSGVVTLRDRDTMKQITLKLDEVGKYIEERIVF